MHHSRIDMVGRVGIRRSDKKIRNPIAVDIGRDGDGMTGMIPFRRPVDAHIRIAAEIDLRGHIVSTEDQIARTRLISSFRRSRPCPDDDISNPIVIQISVNRHGTAGILAGERPRHPHCCARRKLHYRRQGG